MEEKYVSDWQLVCTRQRRSFAKMTSNNYFISGAAFTRGWKDAHCCATSPGGSARVKNKTNKKNLPLTVLSQIWCIWEQLTPVALYRLHS